MPKRCASEDTAGRNGKPTSAIFSFDADPRLVSSQLTPSPSREGETVAQPPRRRSPPSPLKSLPATRLFGDRRFSGLSDPPTHYAGISRLFWLNQFLALEAEERCIGGGECLRRSFGKSQPAVRMLHPGHQ